MRLSYAIKYVSGMDAAIAFHRDRLGLTLAFRSPFRTEFATGGTKLALHPATDDHPAGSIQLGFAADDFDVFHAARDANGIVFTMQLHHAADPAARIDAGTLPRQQGAETTVSG